MAPTPAALTWPPPESVTNESKNSSPSSRMPRNTFAVSPSALVSSHEPLVLEKLRTNACGWLKMLLTCTSDAAHSGAPNGTGAAPGSVSVPVGA